MTETEEILRAHGLRKTNSRMAVLDFLRHERSAVSHGELSQRFEPGLDRVTLYRTLQSFEQKGLIHKVPDDEVSVKYAYCGDEACNHEQHYDNHVHFKCRRCHETRCLHEVSLPHFAIPAGWQREQTEVLISGLCPHCQQNEVA